MLNLVLFGPPGAGKGTQSEKIIAKYKLTHISTGDLFRKHIGEGTPLGKKAKSYTDQGNLVPDEVVIGMVEDFIIQHKDTQGFIFDGFPRTVAQASALDKMLAANNLHVTGMIALEVPDDELRVRIRERGKTSGRIDDQDPEKIENRIRVYKAETTPVADFYRAQGKLNSIKGVGSIDEIFSDITKTLARF